MVKYFINYTAQSHYLFVSNTEGVISVSTGYNFKTLLFIIWIIVIGAKNDIAVANHLSEHFVKHNLLLVFQTLL